MLYQEVTMGQKELVVLVSGASSRFWPLAQDRHKTLYQIGLGESILRHTLRGFCNADWKLKLLITVAPENQILVQREIPEVPHIEALFVHQKEPLGQGDALLRCAEFLKNDTFYLTTGDKLYSRHILERIMRRAAELGTDDLLIATAKTQTPSLYGIIREDDTLPGRIVGVVEKPPNENSQSSRRIVGAYRLNQEFLKLLATLASQEYNFESAIDRYAKSRPVWSVPVDDLPETSLKFPWHLLELNRIVMEQIRHFVHNESKIEQGALITPPVYIGQNAVIAGSAVIRGPCVIREGVFVGDHTLIRDCSYIGRNVVIGAGSEVKNSLIYDGTALHDSHVLDSIIDEDCSLGAGTRVSNSRFDREPVKSVVKSKKVSTGLRHFGIVMGKRSKTATLANFMPGIKVGQDCLVGGSFAVTRDVPDGHVIYMDERGRVVEEARRKRL